MKHQFLTHDNCREDRCCPICDGGLSYCTICKCAEGSLTTECSGSPVDEIDQDRVHRGELDYFDGEWVTK